MVTENRLSDMRIEPEVPDLDLSWLNLDTEWGTQSQPGRKGLTLQQINDSLYGEVPATTNDHSARPRGAAAAEHGAADGRLRDPRGDRDVLRILGAALRRGGFASVVIGDRHSLGHAGRAA